MLAAVGCGIYKSLEDAAVMRGGVQRFIHNMEKHAIDAPLAGWSNALARVLQ
jgi:glycerol kinase